MRVLGIAGSPRRDGNTDQLLDAVMRGAASKGAEVKTIALRDLDYIPCQACDDACVITGDCKYGDDKQTVYAELEQADRIVRHVRMEEQPWKGFFVSVGGTRMKDLFGPALRTVKNLFHVIDVEYAGELVFSGVDEKGEISEQPEALRQAFEAGERLVEEQAGG